MGDVVDNDGDELVEDRFDDESFDDAPLSDPESHFDEQDLLSIDANEHDGCTDDLRLKEFLSRPALSTIPEESKIDDIPTSDITLVSAADGRLSDGLCHSSRSIISQAYSIKSSDFNTNQKASEIIQREEESFLRGHGLFIQDDPRFDRSHFEKENSWEPSIPDQSFGVTEVANNPKDPFMSVKGVTDGDSESQRIRRGTNDKDLMEKVELGLKAPTFQDIREVDALSDLTNAQQRSQLLPVNDVRSTPQRTSTRQGKLYPGNSPRINECTSENAQTSTPVSMIAKLPQRQRLRDLDDMVLDISAIKPDGTSLKEAGRGLGNLSLASSTDTTMLSTGQIQSILKFDSDEVMSSVSSKGIPSGSPSTLMRELEAQRKSRVKLKKPRAFLPPLPPKNQDATNSSKALIPSTIVESNERKVSMHQSAEMVTSVVAAAANVSKPSSTSQQISSQLNASRQQKDGVLKAPSRDVQAPSRDVQEVTIRDEKLSSRPQSVRSSSSLSTVTGARSASQMSSDTSQRSVLFIPQHEVAFGFITIGDTAISTVDVTNRTDYPLRIRAKLNNPGNFFTLLDSQIILLDAHRSTTLRIEFCATQCARFCTSLSIHASGGGGPAVKYRMPVRGMGGTAVVTVKDRDDLRISRNGSYVLQSSYESTFSFTLVNSGKRHAFARTLVLYYGESGTSEQVPVDVRPGAGIVIGRNESRQISIRLRSSLPFSDWRSSQNSIASSASTTQRAVSPLQVVVYWGEERTRRRLRCYEEKTGVIHSCENLQFTDKYVGEEPEFAPPQGHPVSKEDVRLFDQTLRMYIIYVCSPRIRPRQSLSSNSSLERSLQPDDTLRERTVYNTLVVPDQTIR
ncbi:hypothetical protein Y032_0399g741 [Ancylostoma ceylanicum]|uniref:Cep192/Spd-2-like domain-containing protein n=1 Tax=Ancylostoma ceylanicum TaxID=53326 RepID=A0A016RR53_9BILA|nr:hypothetical protein Y032_0399g741 [Ancylostoma ceylanicum]